MKDLNYTGEEPAWAKIDFIENHALSHHVDPTDPRSLLNEIDRLKIEKGEIAAELQNAQDMITLKDGIIKNKNDLLEEEVNKYKIENRTLKAKLEQTTNIAQDRKN